MEAILREILAELKAIRLILAPESRNNRFHLAIIPTDECVSGEGRGETHINSSVTPSPDHRC